MSKTVDTVDYEIDLLVLRMNILLFTLAIMVISG